MNKDGSGYTGSSVWRNQIRTQWPLMSLGVGEDGGVEMGETLGWGVRGEDSCSSIATG